MFDLREKFLRPEASLGDKKISNRKTPPVETLRRRDDAEQEEK
jgi:hypothetical protein